MYCRRVPILSPDQGYHALLLCHGLHAANLHTCTKWRDASDTHTATQTHDVINLWCAAEGQLAELVQHLQREKRNLDGENQSLQQVITRLKGDLEASNSRASQAEQARLEAAEGLRNSLRSQEHQERLMQQVQEHNLLRESNITLRSVVGTYQMCPTMGLLYSFRHAGHVLQ